jgi:hypothetical protein
MRAELNFRSVLLASQHLHDLCDLAQAASATGTRRRKTGEALVKGGAPSTVSGASTGSDRQADARPSRSVGMDLVCVTLRWREVDSNHWYRVMRSRFRERLMSLPLDFPVME